MFAFLKNMFGNNDEEICNTNRSKKLFFSGYEQLSISASLDKKVLKTQNEAYDILKKYKDEPKKILNYINIKGTNVLFVPQLLPVLAFLGYDEGFIPEHRSFKTRILNIAKSIVMREKVNFSDKLEDSLFVCRKEISLYFVGYNLYHWLAYKNKLPGYDFKTLSLFKSTFVVKNCNLSALSLNQLLSIKDSVDRDKEACDFVMKFVQEQISTKERLESILDGKKVQL